MAVKTQGTDLYAMDPADDSLIVVGCVTSIDGIDTPIEQVDITCLSDLARTFMAGLANPGTATFGINVDPSDESHVRLHQLKVAGTTLQWAIGWSEAPGTPPGTGTDTQGDPYFTNLPTTRSWLLFEGFMNSFPFSFAQNSAVQSTVGIQVSGEPVLVPKA